MYLTTVKEDEEGQYIEIPQEYRVDCDTLMVHRVGPCLYLFSRSCPHPPKGEEMDDPDEKSL